MNFHWRQRDCIPSPLLRAIQIFLLVLIILGIVLLLTQKLWVPKVVEYILKDEEVTVLSFANDSNVTSNVNSNELSTSSIATPSRLAVTELQEEGINVSQELPCNGKIYEWTYDATTSPNNHYQIFRDIQNGGFCVKDVQSKIDKVYQLDLPKGWAYHHFSDDGNLLYYETGFYELPGDFTPEEEREIEIEAKSNNYGMHELNLGTGEDTLVTPWSW